MRCAVGGRAKAFAATAQVQRLAAPPTVQAPFAVRAPGACKQVAQSFSSGLSTSAPMAVLSRTGGVGAAAARIATRSTAVGLDVSPARRLFSTTAICQASSPAPNVAPLLPDAATPADALTTLADPAVFGWWPSSFAELGIVAVHEATGLPWWQCIAGITLAVRTLLFPLVVYQVPVAGLSVRLKLIAERQRMRAVTLTFLPCCVRHLADEKRRTACACQARDGARHEALEGARRLRSAAAGVTEISERSQAAL